MIIDSDSYSRTRNTGCGVLFALQIGISLVDDQTIGLHLQILDQNREGLCVAFQVCRNAPNCIRIAAESALECECQRDLLFRFYYMLVCDVII